MDRIVNRRAVTLVTLSLMLGIFIGGLTAGNILLLAIIPTVLAAVGIVFLFGLKRPLICAAYLAVSVGILLFHIDCSLRFDGNLDGEYEVTARIESADGYYAVAEDLTFDGAEYKGRARVKGVDLRTGDLVSFRARVVTLSRDIFDAYDMSAYNDSVYYELTPTDGISAAAGKLKFFERVKRRITAPMYRFMDDEDAGIAASLFFGDKSGLTPSDGEVIRGIGMSHVFAVSGLHVGFMTAIVVFLMKKLKAKPAVTLAATLAVLSVYAILTGFPSGIKRAAVMSAVYMSAPILRRKSDNVTALSAACAAILATNPRELFDIGFIMSVAAVAGIILFYTPIYRSLRGKIENKAWKWAAGGIAVTVSANILLLPVCFNVFNTFALYMVLGNLLILPLVTVAYSMVAVGALFSAVLPVTGFLFYPAQFPIVVIRLLAELIYSLPHAVLTVESMGAATVCYIAAVFFVCRLNKLPARTKLAGLSVLSVTGLVLMFVL